MFLNAWTFHIRMPRASLTRDKPPSRLFDFKIKFIMAKFHQITSEKGKYIIVDILCPKDDQGNDITDATYRFLKLTTETGVSVFNRYIIQADDEQQYTRGATITLHAWSMNIIPVKLPNRNKPGEYKTIRTVSGLAATEPACVDAATRAAQRLYDDAELIAQSAEARALARKELLFCNFVDRTQFIEELDDED